METQAQKPADRALFVRIDIQAGDPIGGRIEVDGTSEPILFSGWIELMAAINNARLAAAT